MLDTALQCPASRPHLASTTNWYICCHAQNLCQSSMESCRCRCIEAWEDEPAANIPECWETGKPMRLSKSAVQSKLDSIQQEVIIEPQGIISKYPVARCHKSKSCFAACFHITRICKYKATLSGGDVQWHQTTCQALQARENSCIETTALAEHADIPAAFTLTSPELRY